MYCFNNPSNYVDSSGFLAITLTASAFYLIYNAVLSIGVTIIIGEHIYRVVSFTKTSKGQNVVKLTEEKNANKPKKPKKPKKQSKKSGKEGATDAPDWAKRRKYDKGKTAAQNAEDALNEKYGKGNWKKGANSEFSKIKKWLQRSLGYK